MFSQAEKRQMNEANIRSKFITPAIKNAGWVDNQIDEEYSVKQDKNFTDGKVQFDPKTKQTTRLSPKRADYLLYLHANKKIAIVEAKDNKHRPRDGLQQAKDYASLLDVPFVYSSNGDQFIEFDFFTGVERTLLMNEFPTPQELEARFKKGKSYTADEWKIIHQPYHTDAQKQIEPRYYQEIAINRTVEAVARGQDRILLVMATGTGKTYTAFQIIHRLKAAGAKRKVLFLADRNILVDQPMREDFKPFKNTMIKVSQGKLDSSYEIYLALYQQLDGSDGDPLFTQFQRSFFDLVVIDECHRGSAREDSNWRKILDYFNQATHIGMTATPKESVDASNISYFGDPIYTYSLKQGIEDGFLAPYRVMRVDLDCDKGWRPQKGMLDAQGNPVEDRIYTVKDFDYNIILHDRTQLVAEKISNYLRNTDRLAKTIVFCANIDHASRMTEALSRQNADMLAINPRYVTQITGDMAGKNVDLEDFCRIQNEGNSYPVIAVTSKLMTTGVNSRMCKLVVLDQNLQSMTEFKQIIGRGTRLVTHAGKSIFTIMDFRNVTNLFADPSFDGEPEVILDPTVITEPPKPKESDDNIVDEPEPIYAPEPQKEIVIIPLGQVQLQIIDEKVQYLNERGELVLEDINDFSKRHIQNAYPNFETFKTQWQNPDVLSRLFINEQWITALRKSNQLDNQFDDFDLIGKVAFNKTPLTKSERVNKLKQRGYFENAPAQQRQILDLLLDQYVQSNEQDITNIKLLETPKFKQLFGGAVSVIKQFGGKIFYEQSVRKLKQFIYTE